VLRAVPAEVLHRPAGPRGPAAAGTFIALIFLCVLRRPSCMPAAWSHIVWRATADLVYGKKLYVINILVFFALAFRSAWRRSTLATPSSTTTRDCKHPLAQAVGLWKWQLAARSVAT
jgi:hypothetical protein